MIASEEFAERRTAAARAAREEGLAGLLVCSRGGGTLDRFADVFYLSRFYTSFPYIPDVAGNWSGRAHAILLLRADGEARLVVDVPHADAALPEDCVLFAEHLADGVASAMRGLGIESGPVGLVGSDTLPASLYREIGTKLPGIEWREAQALLNRLKAVKSPAEIELLRRASDLGSRTIEAMMDAVAPGRTHGEIMARGMEVLLPAGGMLYNAFIRSGSGGPQPAFVNSSLPTWGSREPAEEGQFFCAGISGILDGYYFDLARCRPVGRVSNAQIDAFETAIEVVEAGVAACRPGATGGEVFQAGRERQDAAGYPPIGSFQGFGHGIGLGWDEPWLAPGAETVLQPGNVICVEKWLMRDGYAADFEETVLVTKDGAEKLTNARMRYW